MRKIILVLAFILPISAWADLSDADAKTIAVKLNRTLSKAKENLNKLIAADDRSQYSALRFTVSSALKEWPNVNLSNRAAFPYSDCPQMGRDLLQYGDLWVRNDKNKTWRGHVLKEFHDSEAGCKSSIKKPDMSLKNIQ